MSFRPRTAIGADPKAAGATPRKKKGISDSSMAASPPTNKELTPTTEPARTCAYKDIREHGNASVGGSSSAASPPEALAIPEEAKPHWELGWLSTFENIDQEWENEIITSWRESKVAVFAPSERYDDSELMLACVALKDCKKDKYPNSQLWSEAKRRVRELPPHHASFRTLSHGFKADGYFRGYPKNNLPIHLICQTNLKDCVDQSELNLFFDEIASKSRYVLDQPNDRGSPPLIVAGHQGNLPLCYALLRHGAGSSRCSKSSTCSCNLSSLTTSCLVHAICLRRFILVRVAASVDLALLFLATTNRDVAFLCFCYICCCCCCCSCCCCCCSCSCCCCCCCGWIIVVGLVL